MDIRHFFVVRPVFSCVLAVLPVARAVAASMAVPVVASPITLWNHSSNCPVRPRAHRSWLSSSIRATLRPRG